MDLDLSQPSPRFETLEQAQAAFDGLWQALLSEREAHRAQLREQEQALAPLVLRVQQLEERLNTNSRNSSQPPSKDRPDQKPPRTSAGGLKSEGTRKRGGQKGHRGVSRMSVDAAEVSQTVAVSVQSSCEGCGGKVRACGRPWVLEQAELPEIRVVWTRYELENGVCQGCGRAHRARLPAGVAPGLLGVNLLALSGLLVTGYQVGRRGVRSLLSALVGLRVSTGALSRAETQLAQALEPIYEQARQAVAQAPAVHMDETGSRRDGKRSWLWLAATATMAVFLVSASRGGEAFRALVGRTFSGLLTSDRWHVYNHHDTTRRQVCWAHLLRDFLKIAERPCASKVLGQQLIDQAVKMFEVWGRFKQGCATRDELKLQMQPIREAIKARLTEATRLEARPQWEQTIATCRNLLELEPALWTFLEHEGVEPTNNHAERLIRNAVLCRNRSHGTWSERGDRFLERTLTAVVTLRLQAREPLPWLIQALHARFGLGHPPSLISA